MGNIYFFILIAVAISPSVCYIIRNVFERYPYLAQRFALKDKNGTPRYWKIPGSIAAYLTFSFLWMT